MLNIEKYKDIVLKNLDACRIDERLPRKFINGYCNGFNCEGCGERVLKWLLEEAKEPVLDDVEKEYLSAGIKPFRKKISCIRKSKDPRKGKNYIKIEFCDGDRMFFPNLSNDEMYKGMELDRNYTLEELGL
jgi:hypothetical protein